MQKSILSPYDLLFAGVNGFIFGLMVPIVAKASLSVEISLILSGLTFSAVAISGILVGYILYHIKPFFFQLSKFCATGAANFAIDLGVLNLFIVITGVTRGFEFGMFKAIAFVVATLNSYAWNKYWSFGDRADSDINRELAKFMTISGLGFVLNVSVASFMNNIIGQFVAIDPRIWATISAVIASISVIVWNFLGYKFLVFKK